MERSDVRVVIGIVFLLALVLGIHNSHWFVPNRLDGDGQAELEEEKGADEIMEKAKGDRNEFTVSEGLYYFGADSGGIFDITSNDDNMQVDGKILNKGCCLENYMPTNEDCVLEIKGEGGTVTFRTIAGKVMNLEEKKGKKLIKNSGYYLGEMIKGTSEGEMTMRCKVNDGAQGMPSVQIIETYTREVIDEFQWETGEEGYTFKLEERQSIFVDLGNETKEKRNTLYVMH